MINTEYLWLNPERGCKYRTILVKQRLDRKKIAFRRLILLFRRQFIRAKHFHISHLVSRYFCKWMTDFTDKLLEWYHANARDFPFRRTTDPYLIWLSEIIMQQTRIEQGVPYYNKLIKVFPTVYELAEASEEEVLKQWQGLGYYTRARNLHSTANEIVGKYGGRFPETYENLRSLKGVGDYTAASIASVCFGLPHPVMDGNVIRFVTRHFGIKGSIGLSDTKKKILEVLNGLMGDCDDAGYKMQNFPHPTSRIPHQREALHPASRISAKRVIPHPTSGTFNQAMIEFGATCCKPRNPDCPKCIFNPTCYAYKHDMVGKLPLKKQPRQLKPRYFHYLAIRAKGKKGLYFRKREGNDIWKGLYEFPLIETSKAVTLPKLMNSPEWQKLFGKAEIKILDRTGPIHHLLSHQKIIANFYKLEIGKPSERFGNLIRPQKIHELPVARILEKYLDNVIT